ncbi:MAG TPA: shikimate dehydrogenase, partial [Saprospiraceae bacterium]|nr:shikimate dehydrogenase [Saprospiraceae bacterium]
SYDNYPIADILEVRPLLMQDVLGFNVTIPYKTQIIPFLDELDEEARQIGAVNTIVKVGDYRWKGYNTDASGFRDSLLNWFGGKSLPAKALVLGTGGASKAISYALDQLGTSADLVSRHFHGRYTYAELDLEVIETYKLIINTTPVGMHPHEDQFPLIPYQFLTADHWLYDLIYNPVNTLFLRRGSQAGAMTKNGLEMLHLQAEQAWSIWKTYGQF